MLEKNTFSRQWNLINGFLADLIQCEGVGSWNQQQQQRKKRCTGREQISQYHSARHSGTQSELTSLLAVRGEKGKGVSLLLARVGLPSYLYMLLTMSVNPREPGWSPHHYNSMTLILSDLFRVKRQRLTSVDSDSVRTVRFFHLKELLLTQT